MKESLFNRESFLVHMMNIRLFKTFWRQLDDVLTDSVPDYFVSSHLVLLHYQFLLFLSSGDTLFIVFASTFNIMSSFRFVFFVFLCFSTFSRCLSSFFSMYLMLQEKEVSQFAAYLSVQKFLALPRTSLNSFQSSQIFFLICFYW